ncbi:hypothetical protein K402DRAFT_356273 [Aulographum hederae CBS 113979]|uniref:IEC3 subunit of the Ino80 complex, chromatin re-modelling-domain-containing protein n=1 Tax=Aulographum hederae CBS 113979 TaxID=1176131 RepID=A0A6G1GZV2_9PEZI|nr:hypothetical protein K402DRAFT_356273 [Aulographum hederae CBS 113979]
MAEPSLAMADHHAPPDVLHPPPKDPKAPLRSWRKKFRKMKVRFDKKMEDSNSLFKDEQRAMALARRLQEQNDQLLELLLDMNENPHIPNYLRFDLSPESPSLSAVPSLEPETALDPTECAVKDLQRDFMRGVVTEEEFTDSLERILRDQPAKLKSLSTLVATTSHSVPAPDQPLPADLEGDILPGYLDYEHEEEYLADIDRVLNEPSAWADDTSGRPLRVAEKPQISDKELAVRNPMSVTSWLRRYQPDVFLQDKDKPDKDAASEKSTARGGNKGKRASNAHASKPVVDVPAEDAETWEAEATPSGKGRRKTKDDDAYRPKGGSSKPTKRKREDGAAEKGERKKLKASGGAGTPG